MRKTMTDVEKLAAIAEIFGLDADSLRAKEPEQPPAPPEPVAVVTQPMPPERKQLVSRAKVQEMLGGVGRSTIYELQIQKKLNPVSLTGKVRGLKYYRLEEVEALLNSR